MGQKECFPMDPHSSLPGITILWHGGAVKKFFPFQRSVYAATPAELESSKRESFISIWHHADQVDGGDRHDCLLGRTTASRPTGILHDSRPVGINALEIL